MSTQDLQEAPTEETVTQAPNFLVCVCGGGASHFDILAGPKGRRVPWAWWGVAARIFSKFVATVLPNLQDDEGTMACWLSWMPWWFWEGGSNCFNFLLTFAGLKLLRFSRQRRPAKDHLRRRRPWRPSAILFLFTFAVSLCGCVCLM